MTTRVFLADDHPLTLAGLTDVLGQIPEVEVVGTANNGIRAIALIKSLKPDCAILDLSMPGATGLEVVLEARRWSVETRFVVVTGTGTPNVLQEIVRADVEGIMLKNAPVEDICEGVLKVAQGQRFISDQAQAILDSAEDTSKLTARELEVLQAIARGQTNQAASEALGISSKTIDTHRTNLMRKLGVRSTASLLVRAMRDGLIDLSDID